MQGCSAATPQPHARGSWKAQAGQRLWEPGSLNGYGWVASARHCLEGCLSSFSWSVAKAVSAGSWPHRGPARPGPPPQGLSHKGWMGLPEAGSALRGPPGHPLGSQGAAAFQPQGTETAFLGPQETEAEMNIY